MKPRTKRQFRVMELSKKLKPITDKHRLWAERQTTKLYVMSRGRYFCLECGHKWVPPTKLDYVNGHQCECPGCKSKIEYYNDNTVSLDRYYVAVMNTCKGFQVVRVLLIDKHLKKKQGSRTYVREVMQHWIKPDGKRETLMVPTGGFGGCYDVWQYGHLEPRTTTYSHGMRERISPKAVYPSPSVLPIFKRNGFKSSFHGHGPYDFLMLILDNSKSETLLKTKQYDLLKHYGGSRYELNSLWPSVKICIRQKYIIKDATMWFDYLNLLRHFGKDIRNPKFICPKNLKKEHDILMTRRANEREIIRQNDIALRAKQYIEEKKKFFGVMIKSNDIEIRPLKSVEEFKQESAELKHCVYSSKYYNKKHSLIMSAKIEGKSVETIEIDLEKLKIVQCRGKNNGTTEYHDQIIEMVEKNISLVAKANMNKLKTA